MTPDTANQATSEDTASPTTHENALARSERLWDRWSSYGLLWELYARDTAPVRAEAIEHLDLDRGDAVLDVGCGRGVNFERLHETVGPEGRIVGVDYSRGMLRRAAKRVDDRGWENVELVRVDATRARPERGGFDGALATTAVSAMPDVRTVVENVRHGLAPSARFALYDIRLVPSGPARVLNPLVSGFYRRFGNWNAEEDVLDELRATFEDVAVTRTFALGTNYVAVASTAADGA